jgi:hypothetical protein
LAPASAPWKPPIGVRANETMTTGSALDMLELHPWGFCGGINPLRRVGRKGLAQKAGDGGMRMFPPSTRRNWREANF